VLLGAERRQRGTVRGRSWGFWRRELLAAPPPPQPLRRTDHSERLAAEARLAFAANVARGEAGVDLAEAALQIAAEDDAIGGPRAPLSLF
jgi:hypothetical protein